MRRWLFENLRLKLLALFIACALWAYQDSKQVLEHRKMTLRLDVTDIPAGMDLDPNVRTSASVLLVGSKETIQDLDPEDLSATVSLKDTPANQGEIIVHPKIQSLPKGVTGSVREVKIRLVTANNPNDSTKKRSRKN